MLNNFINGRDFYDLLHKGPKAFSQLGSRLMFGEQRLVKSAWAHTEAAPTNWWDIPAVRMRWNYLVSGSTSVGYHQYISQKWLNDRRAMYALSLGCGTGHHELTWVGLEKFERIDAYDLSEQRIRAATAAAAELGYGATIRYEVGDVFGIAMQEGRYDVILAEQSLHHFSPLDKILSRIRAFLKRDGFFIVNEFTGPTRFQWTGRQLEAVNGVLSALPVKFKTLWNSDQVKKNVIRPSRLRMLLSDPSEAVESERIVPLLRDMFEIVELKGYGGSILHLLFNGIAHNFLGDDAETRDYLDIIFRVEDMLLKSRDIQNDFIVAVCVKR